MRVLGHGGGTGVWTSGNSGGEGSSETTFGYLCVLFSQVCKDRGAWITLLEFTSKSWGCEQREPPPLLSLFSPWSPL